MMILQLWWGCIWRRNKKIISKAIPSVPIIIL